MESLATSKSGLANLVKLRLRVRVGVVVWISTPECAFVNLQSLVFDTPKHHGSDSPVERNLNGIEIVTLGAFAAGFSFSDTNTPP